MNAVKTIKNGKGIARHAALLAFSANNEVMLQALKQFAGGICK
jgi:hypothetical protein